MQPLPKALNDEFTVEPSIVYQDDDLVILMKPSHVYVHPPECRIARKTVGRKTCIHWLMDRHKIMAHPAHRLDFATEGLVIFCKNTKTSSEMNKQMREHAIQKEYDVIVRGWLTPEKGQIDKPLELDSTGELVPALTIYKTLKKIELDYSVNSRFPTSRYSWLHVELKTGRWHQIRRHMNRIAHPVIGDREHGDSHHNRFFRDHLHINGLCLKAKRLKFLHPHQNTIIDATAPQTELWNNIHLLFNPL
ncbi:MAG: pseudouridine synthase [Pseudobdellovibrio sp.]